MLRRIIVFPLAFIIAFNAMAQETATAPATQLSGSATFGIGEQNLLDSPYVVDIPGLSTSANTSSISIKYTDGSSLSYIDLTQYMDVLKRQSRMGFEVGVTLDAANLYTFTAQTSKYTSNGDSSWYNLIQPMIDWYVNNSARYGMPSSPYTSGVWPTDNYDSSSSGRTRFIFGNTVVPISYIAWDLTKWYDAQKLYSELKLKIEGAIDGISAQASNGKIIDQYAYAKFVEADKVSAQNELAAWTAFHIITDNYNSNATLTGPNIKSAYILLTNVAGVLDARADFSGVKLTAGSLLGATRADQLTSGPGFGLALPVGLIPNVNASISGNIASGVSSIIENYETKNSEALPGEPSWIGLKFRGGYSIPDALSANLAVQWPDFITRPLTLSTNLNATLVGNNAVFSYSAVLEGNFISWQDRYVATADPVIAYGGGLDARLTAFGATPHALVLYKSAGFWGTGGNNEDDRFTGLDLRSDFNNVKVCDALAFDAGVSFDPFPFIGMSLVSVDGGYLMLMYDLADRMLTLGQGWYAGVNVNLMDIAELPMSISATVSSYQNWGPYAGAFTDWNDAPTSGLLAGLTWIGNVNFDPVPNVSISVYGSGRPSGWRMDTQPVIALGMRASIKF